MHHVRPIVVAKRKKKTQNYLNAPHHYEAAATISRAVYAAVAIALESINQPSESISHWNTIHTQHVKPPPPPPKVAPFQCRHDDRPSFSRFPCKREGATPRRLGEQTAPQSFVPPPFALLLSTLFQPPPGSTHR